MIAKQAMGGHHDEAHEEAPAAHAEPTEGHVSPGVESHAKHPPYWMVIPFALLLLGIAVLPLIPFTEHWWESICIGYTGVFGGKTHLSTNLTEPIAAIPVHSVISHTPADSTGCHLTVVIHACWGSICLLLSS